MWHSDTLCQTAAEEAFLAGDAVPCSPARAQNGPAVVGDLGEEERQSPAEGAASQRIVAAGAAGTSAPADIVLARSDLGKPEVADAPYQATAETGSLGLDSYVR